jgi:adenine/guanine phosphoribosyltransferase-like PRPP-binding protein
MIQSAGVDRLLTIDLHSDQIQGFFDIPVDNVYASPVLLGDAYRQRYENLIVVSPDVGGVVRARALAKRLDDADLAIIDKRRPRPNESKVMNIIGEVKGKTCVHIDDMVDTAGTLAAGAQALKDEGAIKVVAYITHAILSGKCHREDFEVRYRRAGGDRHHPAVAGGEAVWTHPAAVGCGVAGRDHPSHSRRGFGEQPVPGLDGAGPGNRDNSRVAQAPSYPGFPARHLLGGGTGRGVRRILL